MADEQRPDFVKDFHLSYLDDLMASGVTNMFAAAPYLQFFDNSLSINRARKILSYWMDTFSDRHPKEVADEE